MQTSRRHFVGRVAAGAAASAAALGALPRSLEAMSSALAPSPAPASGASGWDVTWARRLTGKHRGVFDVPEVESGYGVWRATIWARQYQAVLGAAPSSISTALVLRHNGIALAMQQEFWDRYGVGKAKGVTHPLTLQPTDRNPALLSAKAGDLPEQFAGVSLPEFLARGGVALACDLAFQDCVSLVQATDKLDPAAARERALAALVPGVIMQPSGVFAVMLAQDSGCSYIRAS